MKFESLNINSNEKKEKLTLKEKFSKVFRSKVLIGALSIASIGTFESCTGHNDYSEFKTFNEAFKKARENDEKVFKWNGGKYTTELVGKETSDLYFESKKFLEDYYSSDYFKSKQIVDSFMINLDISMKYMNAPRYKYLDDKLNETGSLTLEEENEFYQLLLAQDEKTSYESEEFQHRADSAQAAPGKERIKNLKRSTYFSITNKKDNEHSHDGHYRHNDKSVFIYVPEDKKDVTTPVHELTHKSTHGDSAHIKQYFEIKEKAFNSVKDSQEFISRYGQKGFDYLSTPTEIDARQNSTRFWLFKNFRGYKPDTVFTGDHYDFLSENYKVLPYDIQQLMDLFPKKEIFISNMNTY